VKLLVQLQNGYKNPSRLLMIRLRAENGALNDRLKGISDEFGAINYRSYRREQSMIAEFEAQARPDVPKQTPA